MIQKIRKSALLLFAILLWQSGFSQMSYDSLRNTWKNKSLHDSIRFDALSKIFELGTVYSYYDSLIYYAELEIREARKHEMPKYLAHGLSWKANHFMQMNLLDTSLLYLDSASSIYKRIGDEKGLAFCEVFEAYILFFKDESEVSISMAEETFLRMKEAGYVKEMYMCSRALVALYGLTGDFTKRMHYTKIGFQLAKEMNEWVSLAEAYHTMADLYLAMDIAEQGDSYHNKALEYCRKSGYAYEEMNIIGHLATIEMKRGNFDKSFDYLNKIYKWEKKHGGAAEVTNLKAKEIYILIKAERFDEASVKIDSFRKSFTDLGLMSSVYLAYVNYAEGLTHVKTNDAIKGAELCLKAYNGYAKYKQYQLEIEACDCLYEAYKSIGDYKTALEYNELGRKSEDNLKLADGKMELNRMEYHKQQLADSLAHVESEMLLQMEYEKGLRQEEKSRNIAISVGAMILLLAGSLYGRLRLVRKSKAIVEKEKHRSDELLLNILPAEVAEELKNTGESEAKHFDEVSILFTDFKGFTQVSEKLSAKKLVNEINTCFKAFDHICEKYGIEKIKTIGDSYMAAVGLKSEESGPRSTLDIGHWTRDIVLAALEMQQFITTRNQKLETQNSSGFKMRAGIHTGPVVAGIVGVKKFQHDIWGDTVNTASRMESHGEVGKVNISEATYQILRHSELDSESVEFSFEEREELEIKGKGLMKTYFVSSKTI